MLRPISRRKERGRDLQKQNPLEKGSENSSPFKMFISLHFLWSSEFLAETRAWLCRGRVWTPRGERNNLEVTALRDEGTDRAVQAADWHHQTFESFLLAPAQRPAQPLTLARPHFAAHGAQGTLITPNEKCRHLQRRPAATVNLTRSHKNNYQQHRV